MKKRISVISPCWNGEKHLKPYVDGLLSQTCSDVEYIFVDDGSTDGTGRSSIPTKTNLNKRDGRSPT